MNEVITAFIASICFAILIYTFYYLIIYISKFKYTKTNNLNIENKIDIQDILKEHFKDFDINFIKEMKPIELKKDDVFIYTENILSNLFRIWNLKQIIENMEFFNEDNRLDNIIKEMSLKLKEQMKSELFSLKYSLKTRYIPNYIIIKLDTSEKIYISIPTFNKIY